MKSKLLCSDNLPILKSMESEVVDLIYLDPPFNKGKQFYKNEVGFSDSWSRSNDLISGVGLTDTRVCKFLDSIPMEDTRNYLTFMAVRLEEMYRVLKNTGSIYLHCDPTASHYLKILLDYTFGVGNFRNEIIWYYRRWTRECKYFQKIHDIILFYSMSDNYVWNKMYQPFSEMTVIAKYARKLDKKRGVIVEDKSKLLERDAEKGVCMHDVWSIPVLHPQTKERTGYPTQKPLALLERIIGASSNESDIVLDPFCGSGTTCVAAKRMERNWIGIDTNEDAIKVARNRMRREF